MDGAMVAHVELRSLAVELRLGAVARVREPARVLMLPNLEKRGILNKTERGILNPRTPGAQ
jgi:hypothetical protein